MIELPFNSIEFAEIWQDYLEHRESKKKPYKNNRSMAMGLKKLVRISHNNEEIAIAIIENTIEQDWQGLFPLDNKDPLMQKLKNTKVNQPQKLSASEILRQKHGISSTR